ncbi:MAG: hypothetical protein RR053_08635 [Evtepia sp.]
MKKNTFIEAFGSLTPELEGAPLTEIHETRSSAIHTVGETPRKSEEGDSN